MHLESAEISNENLAAPGGYAGTESRNDNEKARHMFLRITVIAAAAIAATAIDSRSPANADPLQPGPHSAIADVDLPVGTVQCIDFGCIDGPAITDPGYEWWRYVAPYDDIVAFMRDRFGTGRQYDAHGATWWHGLPPCYDANHDSPPSGWATDGGTRWIWSDNAKALVVAVDKPGIKAGDGDIVPFGRIYVISVGSSVGAVCYRE
ncbi:MAG: hypothetical protein ACLPXZ_28195 [Mycobacterium sp.]